MKLPKAKIAFIILILLVYAGAGVGLRMLVTTGTIPSLPPTPQEQYGTDTKDDIGLNDPRENLKAAQAYVANNFVRANGHIDLYHTIDENATFEQDLNTNSEAVSYYLLWTAIEGDKEAFDKELAYVEQHMIHPATGHMMWRLTPEDVPVDDGTNIASDADLRAIKSLMIAEERWGDRRYTRMIDTLATGIEKVAITHDTYLAPYGGASGETSAWTANEIWLSYEDFVVMKELSERRGPPWTQMYENMKNATIEAQIHNGLYNSQLTQARQYGNGIDGGGYSINSMWIMIRAAESDDPELQESARRSLDFYKEKYLVDAALYATYSSNGDPLSPSETPWVYALVGRAAAALGDRQFSESMARELIDHQVMNATSDIYGAIPEGEPGNRRVGQFTMQESILTLQEHINQKNK